MSTSYIIQKYGSILIPETTIHPSFFFQHTFTKKEFQKQEKFFGKAEKIQCIRGIA